MSTQLDAESIPAPAGLELLEVRKYAFATMERVASAVMWLEGEPREIRSLRGSAHDPPEVRRRLIQRRRENGAALREQMRTTPEMFQLIYFCRAETGRELHHVWLKKQMNKLRLKLGCHDGELLDSMFPEKFGELLATHIFPHLVGNAVANPSGQGCNSGTIKHGMTVVPPSPRHALLSFKYVERSLGETPRDKEAYAWLREHGFDGCDELNGYRLPKLDTWCSNLSRGRKLAGESKNSPRGGRRGRSVLPASQL
jgi:hypothetical protein